MPTWVFITFLLWNGEVNETLMSYGHETEAECRVELEEFKEMSGLLLMDTEEHTILYTACEEYDEDDVTAIVPGISL